MRAKIIQFICLGSVVAATLFYCVMNASSKPVRATELLAMPMIIAGGLIALAITTVGKADHHHHKKDG